MYNSNFPLFTKGRVVKKESLEYLRDFPYDFLSLAMEEYSDGIISGFHVCVKDGYMIISKGALKHKGQILVLPENKAPFGDFKRNLCVKMVIHEAAASADFVTCPIEIRVDEAEPDAANEVELGRFYLEEGAHLRCEYDSFADFRTHVNTLNILNVHYAGFSAPTFHTIIMREYGRALLTGTASDTDVSFALMCLNNRVVHKEAIQWHVALKSGKPYADYTLTELYQKLSTTLQQKKQGKRMAGTGFGPKISS